MTKETANDYQQALDEHEELRQVLGHAHKVLSERHATLEEVAELVSSVAEHIHKHFESEENGGLFDSIRGKAPRLAHRVNEILHQHAELSEELIKLRQTVATGPGQEGDQWWNDLSDQFHHFSQDLMRHESAENTLLQDAYNLDVGAGD